MVQDLNRIKAPWAVRMPQKIWAASVEAGGPRERAAVDGTVEGAGLQSLPPTLDRTGRTVIQRLSVYKSALNIGQANVYDG